MKLASFIITGTCRFMIMNVSTIQDLPLAIILHCAAVPHAIRTAPCTHQTGVLLVQNHSSSDSIMKDTGKDKRRKQLKQSGAFRVPEKAENLKKVQKSRWRRGKIPKLNLRKLRLASSKCYWEQWSTCSDTPMGHPATPSLRDRDGEGQRQPAVVGTTPMGSLTRNIRLLEFLQALCSSPNHFLAGLPALSWIHISNIWCLSGTFQRQGLENNAVPCLSQQCPCGSCQAKGQLWRVRGGKTQFPEIRKMGLNVLTWKNRCHNCKYTGQLSVFHRLLLVSTNFWSGS